MCKAGFLCAQSSALFGFLRTAALLLNQYKSCKQAGDDQALDQNAAKWQNVCRLDVHGGLQDQRLRVAAQRFFEFFGTFLQRAGQRFACGHAEAVKDRRVLPKRVVGFNEGRGVDNKCDGVVRRSRVRAAFHDQVVLINLRALLDLQITRGTFGHFPDK